MKSAWKRAAVETEAKPDEIPTLAPSSKRIASDTRNHLSSDHSHSCERWSQQQVCAFCISSVSYQVYTFSPLCRCAFLVAAFDVMRAPWTSACSSLALPLPQTAPHPPPRTCLLIRRRCQCIAQVGTPRKRKGAACARSARTSHLGA